MLGPVRVRLVRGSFPAEPTAVRVLKSLPALNHSLDLLVLQAQSSPADSFFTTGNSWPGACCTTAPAMVDTAMGEHVQDMQQPR